MQGKRRDEVEGGRLSLPFHSLLHETVGLTELFKRVRTVTFAFQSDHFEKLFAPSSSRIILFTLDSACLFDLNRHPVS